MHLHIADSDTGLGHSRDAWNAMTAAKLSNQQTEVIAAIRSLRSMGTTRVHYLDVWRHMTKYNGQIMPQTVCTRIGELITAGRLRVVFGVKDPNGRKGRIVELVARQAEIS
jgi:hypothetical protein